MIQTLYILSIIGFILLGVFLTSFLEKKKWLPKRYVTGCLVFTIILIPSILFPQLPIIIKQLLYVASGLLAIIFFETSRKLLESGNYKGIVNPTIQKKEK